MGWRRYAYGPAQGLPDTKIGTFPQSLYDEAEKDGWFVISMKRWTRIFAFEQAKGSHPPAIRRGPPPSGGGIARPNILNDGEHEGGGETKKDQAVDSLDHAQQFSS